MNEVKFLKSLPTRFDKSLSPAENVVKLIQIDSPDVFCAQARFAKVEKSPHKKLS